MVRKHSKVSIGAALLLQGEMTFCSEGYSKYPLSNISRLNCQCFVPDALDRAFSSLLGTNITNGSLSTCGELPSLVDSCHTDFATSLNAKEIRLA